MPPDDTKTIPIAVLLEDATMSAIGTKRTNRAHRDLSPIGLTTDKSRQRASMVRQRLTGSGHGSGYLSRD
jgi:hypothetical protein